MTGEEKIRFLVVSGDDQLSHQLLQKLQQQFAKMEPEVEIFDQGRKALSDFLSQGAQIVILDSRVAFEELSELSSQIRRRDGGCFVIQLGETDERLDVSDKVTLPIVDWADFLFRVQAGLPDEIKIRFGYFERNSALYEKLIDYGKKWQAVEDTVISKNNAALVLIPLHFDRSSEDSVDHAIYAQKPGGKVVFRKLDEKAQRRGLKIDIAVCLFFTAFGVVFNWIYRDEIWNWLSLRTLAALLSIFAVVAFFLARSFDRFIFNQDVEVSDTSTSAKK